MALDEDLSMLTVCIRFCILNIIIDDNNCKYRIRNSFYLMYAYSGFSLCISADCRSSNGT